MACHPTTAIHEWSTRLSSYYREELVEGIVSIDSEGLTFQVVQRYLPSGNDIRQVHAQLSRTPTSTSPVSCLSHPVRYHCCYRTRTHSPVDIHNRHS